MLEIYIRNMESEDAWISSKRSQHIKPWLRQYPSPKRQVCIAPARRLAAQAPWRARHWGTQKSLAQNRSVLKWVWLKINQEGFRRFWSMFPLTRVSFWYRLFEPQPNGLPRTMYSIKKAEFRRYLRLGSSLASRHGVYSIYQGVLRWGIWKD